MVSMINVKHVFDGAGRVTKSLVVTWDKLNPPA